MLSLSRSWAQTYTGKTNFSYEIGMNRGLAIFALLLNNTKRKVKTKVLTVLIKLFIPRSRMLIKMNSVKSQKASFGNNLQYFCWI